MESRNKNTTSETELLTRQQTEMIQELVNCALACEACSAAALTEQEAGMMARCIALTRDCTDACFQASRLVMRRSEFVDQYLKLCEETCRISAEECRKHPHDHCQIAAEACESCADSCNEMFAQH